MFLASLIFRHNKEIEDIQQKVKVYEVLDKILEKKSEGIKVSEAEYAELYKLDCPHVSFLSLFGGNITISPEGITVPADDEAMLDNCPNIACSECWRQYIDELVAIINSSELLIKVPPPEDDLE